MESFGIALPRADEGTSLFCQYSILSFLDVIAWPGFEEYSSSELSITRWSMCSSRGSRLVGRNSSSDLARECGSRCECDPRAEEVATAFAICQEKRDRTTVSNEHALCHCMREMR